ncbi:hypothetical protein QNI16_31980 [Cytophagaceae bacterium YF14B1]|uniref:Uncharacterized protein n=1 Tax=Xanthocytophaga flava TaxID=3048013 RepID=A0AAE3UAW8_9BACT|nr:hypothetical protein [Xanthocytophaga flavus]MDJ1485162.1 hypothetical protein [Xanthocytophaga flavus]
MLPLFSPTVLLFVSLSLISLLIFLLCAIILEGKFLYPSLLTKWLVNKKKYEGMDEQLAISDTVFGVDDHVFIESSSQQIVLPQEEQQTKALLDLSIQLNKDIYSLEKVCSETLEFLLSYISAYRCTIFVPEPSADSLAIQEISTLELKAVSFFDKLVSVDNTSVENKCNIHTSLIGQAYRSGKKIEMNLTSILSRLQERNRTSTSTNPDTHLFSFYDPLYTTQSNTHVFVNNLKENETEKDSLKACFLLIVPFVQSNQTEAIIEVRGFENFEPSQILFIERTGYLLATLLAGRRTLFQQVKSAMKQVIVLHNAAEMNIKAEIIQKEIEHLKHLQKELLGDLQTARKLNNENTDKILVLTMQNELLADLVKDLRVRESELLHALLKKEQQLKACYKYKPHDN